MQTLMLHYFKGLLSNLLISSGVNNFVTPAGNFCDHMPCVPRVQSKEDQVRLVAPTQMALCLRPCLLPTLKEIEAIAE
jgi:hypothetical protein